MPFITLKRADTGEPIALNLDLVDTIQPLAVGSGSTGLILTGMNSGHLSVVETFPAVMREVARLTRPDLAATASAGAPASAPAYRYSYREVADATHRQWKATEMTIREAAAWAAQLAREVK